MVATEPRRYRSKIREDAAEQTRRRVLDTAARLFAEQGYASTSMRGVAAAAGVSLERVTATGTKSELLLGAFSSTLAAENVLVSDLDLASGDLRTILTPMVRRAVVGIGRSLGIWRALCTAAAEDEKVAHARRRLVARRRRDLSGLVRVLEESGLAPRRSERSRRQVADAIGLLISHEGYEQLVTLCGWSERAYATWAVESAIQELERSASSRPPRR